MTVNYTVSDGNGGTAVSTLTIKVCGTNDAPTAEVDTNSGAEDTLITGTVAINDGDIDDGAVLTFALVDPANAPAGLTFNADGSYSFDAGNAAYQYLAEGEPPCLTSSLNTSLRTNTALLPLRRSPSR